MHTGSTLAPGHLLQLRISRACIDRGREEHADLQSLENFSGNEGSFILSPDKRTTGPAEQCCQMLFD